MSEHPLETSGAAPKNSGRTLLPTGAEEDDEEYHSATEDTEERPDSRRGCPDREGGGGPEREEEEGGGAKEERVELSEEQVKVLGIGDQRLLTTPTAPWVPTPFQGTGFCTHRWRLPEH